MNGSHGIDIVALSWCIPEIRESLARATAELERHLTAEAGSTGHLKNARIHLHQAHGALQVADVSGVLVLTQEAEALIERGEREELAIDGAAVAALRRALSAVAEYLEDLQAGSALPPVVLFSFYRALLLLRGAERIDPADLYFPDLSIQPPASILSHVDAADGDDIGMLAASARREFERGLLGFLRGDDNASAIRTMHAAMVRMQTANPARHARAFFWMSLALLDALKHAALPTDLYAKRLVARVNIQARRTLESQDPVADRLLKDLLFHLARAQDTSPVAAEVRRHYRLAGSVPADFERVRYGLTDPALVRRSREAVTVLKKSWEKMVRGSHKEVDVFTAAAGDLIEALRQLPYEGLSELAHALALVPNSLESVTASDEALSLEVATALLFAEEALDGGLRSDPAYDTRAGQLGGRLIEVMNRPATFSDAAPQWLVDISRKASERITLGAFVTELNSNLRSCEQALDGYFRNPSTVGQLASLEPLIVQSLGVLKALGYIEASKACAAIDEDIRTIVEGANPTTERDHLRIANNLSALGFFVESLLQPAGHEGAFHFDDQSREFHAKVSDRRSNRAEEREVRDLPAMGAEMDVALQVVGSAESRIGAQRSALVPWLTLLAAAPRSSEVHENLQSCLVALERDSVLVDDVGLKRRAGEALRQLQALVESNGATDSSPAQRESLLALLAQLAGVQAPPRVEASEEAAVHEATASSDDEDDRELLDIFLQEADEVLAAIAESLQHSRHAPSDQGPLTTIRRAFHTLKGSSRMVGLFQFGDAGWAFEQVMNKWLADEQPGNPQLNALIEAGRELFSIWVARLHQDPAALMDASALVARCEALRDGKGEVVAVAVPAPSTRVPEPMAVPAEAIAEKSIVDVSDEVVAAVVEELPAEVVDEQVVEAAQELSAEISASPGLEFVAEPIAEVLDWTVAEPVLEAVTEPVVEAVAEPGLEALAKPALEIMTEPVPNVVHEPVLETANEPMSETVDQPLLEAVDESVEESLEEQSVAADLTIESAVEPVTELAGFIDLPDLNLVTPILDGADQIVEPDEEEEFSVSDLEAFVEAGDAFVVSFESQEPQESQELSTSLETVAESNPTWDEDRQTESAAETLETVELDFDLLESIGTDHLTDAFQSETEPTAIIAAPDKIVETIESAAGAVVEGSQSVEVSVPIEAAESIEFAEPIEVVAVEAFVVEPVAVEPVAVEPVAIEPVAVEPVAVEPAAVEPVVPDTDRVRIGTRYLDAQLFEVFNAEAVEIRQRLDRSLSVWREGQESSAPQELVRALHSLVGTSRHVALLQLRGIAEPAEQFLIHHAKSGRSLPADHFALLYTAIASIKAMLEQFAQGHEPARDGASERAMMDLAFRWSNPESIAEPVDVDRADRGEALRKKAAQVLGAARQAAEEEVDAFHGLVDELDADLAPIFMEETDDLLPRIDTSLRKWRSHPADEQVPTELMRLLHTIKGGARMAGAMRFGQMIHEMETRVEEAIGLPEVPETLVDQLLAQYDQAYAAYDGLQHDGSSAPATQSAPDVVRVEPDAPAQAAPVEQADASRPAMVASAAPAAESAVGSSGAASPVSVHAELEPELMAGAAQAAAAAQQVIRVRADLLDRMVNESGEVSVARARLDSEMALIRQSLGELTENVNRLRSQLREIEIQADNQIQAQIAHSKDSHTDFDPLEFDRYTRFQELTKMLSESVNDVATVQQNAMRSVESATLDLTRQGQVSRSLQQNLMRIRMVQFATVSDRLYRVVRQAAKDSDKRVVLELKGGNAEIDRGVLERMAAPMEHLLRNAVAHGIESRAARVAAGKPETGELVVAMRQEGNEVIMSFSDDGAGLDYARIEARARERNLLTEGRKPTERELAQLIFAPGFSTATEVTTLAGRGVGMDVVRAEVSAMGGRIDIDATTGAGTRFTIHLPVSLAVSQVVLLSVDNSKFAVQAALVEQILQVKPEVLAAAYDAHAIECDGESVPMYFLGSLLELSQSRPIAQRQSPVVIVRAGSARIALHVDKVVPNQEVVIKNVGPQLARLSGIAGATVLGNGDIVLILNPVQLALARSANQAGQGDTAHFAATDITASATVMVVDDSVTVRKVTQRLLVREGYTVLLAKDGVDALRQLQDVVPDMMLVDIEMPRMDGFDLTKNVRSTERLRDIPIIMITSRTADKHRNHALSLGVDVFLGKPYAEDELLRHVAGFASQGSLAKTW